MLINKSVFSLFYICVLSLFIIISAPAYSFAQTEYFVKLGAHSWGYVANNNSSSNSSVFVGERSVLIVDPGFTPSGVARLFSRVKTITNKPIQWVVLSHWHPDHVLGSVCRQNSEITLISSTFTQQQIQQKIPSISKAVAANMQNDEDKNSVANCAMQLPSRLVNDEESIDLGNHKIQIFSVPQSHTKGDLVVYSALDQSLASGDLFLRDSAPSTDGGNLNNLAESLSRIIELAPKKIVPGHFDISQVNDLQRFKHYIQAQLNHAAQSISDGLSEQQSIESMNFEAFKDFSQYPQYQATFKDNARAAYQQLKDELND